MNSRAYHFLFAMYSNLAFVTFIFYLYSFFFYSPRWSFVLQTEISGKYNLPLYFCSLPLFFLSLFLPQGSVYCLSLHFGTQDFTDPGLLKIVRTLTGLSWFCLHKCFWAIISYHRLPINYRALHQHVQLQIFHETLVDDCFSAFAPLEISLLIVFRSPVSCSTCWNPD